MVVRGSLPDSAVAATRVDMVIDVQPLSRFGDDLPDIAAVQTAVALQSGRLVQVAHQESVFQSDGVYRLQVSVPPDWAELVKDSDFHVTVLLPRSPVGRWELQLHDEELPTEFDGAATFEVDVSALPGGRTVVTMHGTIDDMLDLVWEWIG